MEHAFDAHELARAGIHFPGQMRYIDVDVAYDDRLAMDAQPGLITSANAGIPSMLTTFVDPRVIDVLVSPMKAAMIVPEVQKGSWVTETAMFLMVENEGQVSSYGDFSNNGEVDINFNFPQRQSYHYQTFTQYGERQIARAGEAKIDYVSKLNISSALILNKFQNQSYLFGISGLQNYGLTNDPALPAPIAPTATWAADAADVIFSDVVRIVKQAVSQSNGLIDAEVKAKLVLSPGNALNLNKTNQYNVNVEDQIKKNFPNITIVTVPEYATLAGELVQLIVDELEGQETADVGFTEKMRAHAIVVDTSSFKQKKSQGTWGAIIFRPFLITQMLG